MKRKEWSEFDKATREYIKERDNNCCVFCGRRYPLQIAHIFLTRAFGGKGSEKNGVLLCLKCHMILDNPIGDSQNEKSKTIKKYCENYLIKKENIDKSKIIDELKYKKIVK